MVKKLVSLMFVLCCNCITAQIHCGSVSIVPNSSVNQIVVFDDFTKYNGGITINSVTRLRIKVEDKTDEEIQKEISSKMGQRTTDTTETK